MKKWWVPALGAKISRGEKAFVKFWSKEGYPKKRVKAVDDFEPLLRGWSGVGVGFLLDLILITYVSVYIYI